MLDQLRFLISNNPLISMGVTTLNPLSVVHQVWSLLELIRLQQLLSPKSPHKSQPPQERLGVKTIKSMLEVLLLPPLLLYPIMIRLNKGYHPCNNPHPSRILHLNKQQWLLNG